VLKDDGDARARAIHRLPVDQNLAGARREQPADTAQQRRFAATRWADDAENFVVPHIEIDVAKGDDRPFEEVLAGVVNHDLCAGGHRKVLVEIKTRRQAA